MAKGIKAILKTAIVNLSFVHELYSWGSIWKVYVDIRKPKEFPSEGDSDNTVGFLRIQGQASSAFDTRDKFIQPRARHHVEKVGSVYGFKAETEMGIFHEADGQYGSNKPEYILAFRKLLASVVRERNLSYKYPDCDLSQLLETLETLGASIHRVEVAYNGQTYTPSAWNAKCREMDKPDEAVA